MKKKKNDTRDRILEAAEELSRELGPGNVSLEAVAARAGVSKGGLLYHFPSKNSLMQAVVEFAMHRFAAALDEPAQCCGPDGMLAAYIETFLEDRACRAKPPSAILAALAENPGLLDPIRTHERTFLDRIRANARDPRQATMIYLALQGIRCMEIMNVQVLSPQETAEILDHLRRCAEEVREETPRA
ncbi:TetR/AcrR family transcriptional regulator [Halodurantibacterium flavum]|uniref:TetR/AcrR family transcriptional regulator n=1 Tax=Halodurantibacterium flavum TaxID=1382802 RepID=A0ABW4S7Q2_9RHOB